MTFLFDPEMCHVGPKKNDAVFIKLLKLRARELLQELTPSEAGFLFKITPYVHFTECFLTKTPDAAPNEELKRFSREELAQEIGVDVMTVTKLMKGLQRKAAILPMGSGNAKHYLVNPDVLFRGETDHTPTNPRPVRTIQRERRQLSMSTNGIIEAITTEINGVAFVGLAVYKGGRNVDIITKPPEFDDDGGFSVILEAMAIHKISPIELRTDSELLFQQTVTMPGIFDRIVGQDELSLVYRQSRPGTQTYEALCEIYGLDTPEPTGIGWLRRMFNRVKEWILSAINTQTHKGEIHE